MKVKVFVNILFLSFHLNITFLVVRLMLVEDNLRCSGLLNIDFSIDIHLGRASSRVFQLKDRKSMFASAPSLTTIVHFACSPPTFRLKLENNTAIGCK